MRSSPATRKLAPAWLLTIALALPASLLLPGAASTHPQNDAGQAGDAGNTQAAARTVTPFGEYTAELSAEAADTNDYYKFAVTAGQQINIEVRDVLLGGSLVAGDNQRRLAFRLLDPNGVLLDTPNTNQGDTRVAIAAAPVSGNYYFQVTKSLSNFAGTYRFCFVVVNGASHSCPDIGMRPIKSFSYGALEPWPLLPPKVRVVLVPPTHGDLGNPLGGPSVTDYLTTTINAIHKWETVMDAFAADYPQYDYLADIDVDLQVWDGVGASPGPADVIVTFLETSGTAFRGLAAEGTATRLIVLSLFASSPRGGQLVPDYPEINDLWNVVLHEFAHTFGMGHTLTWDAALGPDLMNSPATFMYGDGNPVGDGGERTPADCISTLDLFAMAQLYAWMPSGTYQSITGEWSLPGNIPYTAYC